MSLSFLLGGAVGYVLGSRAGRERYEAIVRLGRRVAGSQTVQSAAGVLQAQVDSAARQAGHTVVAKLRHCATPPRVSGINGHRRGA